MLLSAEELKNQLRKFNLMGYSDISVKYADNGKNGKVLTLTDELWKYEDEFYGGEPYSGNETIWLNGQDVFRCVYWGKVESGIDFGNIYNFLRDALKTGPSGNCVHRGPQDFSKDNLHYINACTGTIEHFTQTEKIFLNNQLVYTAYFIGGRINTRK
ncbi:hypothetical protein GYA27_00530 [candidate division WWE3 bacterium]|uniref:DUF5680 domain-containing protein n=1 Tax=candidate division WWE3 bacterium TaxID=2053526 RepID=A0A7X9DJQ6_UNCKA|nr:hypothetical protein [candidate division WWE3 bacterium]